MKLNFYPIINIITANIGVLVTAITIIFVAVLLLCCYCTVHCIVLEVVVADATFVPAAVDALFMVNLWLLR